MAEHTLREIPSNYMVGLRGDAEVLKTKSCPRCKKGDLALDRDHHGWYQYCLQCGYMCDLVSVAGSEKKQVSGNRTKPAIPSRGDSKRA